MLGQICGNKMIRLLALLCALSLVVSCGQPGKLYLPDEPQSSNAAVSLPASDNLSETLFT
jgi:predicted small lipoprotein YifL